MTYQQQHTPGPWHVEREDEADPTVWTEQDCIATVWLLAGQSQANARLIAAAPDLLEAAKVIVETNEADDWPGIDLLRRVIAKAEGEGGK